MEESELDDS